MGIGADYVRREIVAKDPKNNESREYIETVERSFGPMKKLYLQIEFTPAVDRELRRHWDAHERQERFAIVRRRGRLGSWASWRRLRTAENRYRDEGLLHEAVVYRRAIGDTGHVRPVRHARRNGGQTSPLSMTAFNVNAMPNTPHPDTLLVEQIRAGQPDAWNVLIAQYEGRLLSFVDSRLHRRASSEDVVQETFIGFLTSLPNYDTRRPLESYLFSIAAHKLTDYLRREGRRPALPLSSTAAQHRRHLGHARRRPPGQQHRPQRRTPRPGGRRPGPRHRRANQSLARKGRLGKSEVHGAALRPRRRQQRSLRPPSASPSNKSPTSNSTSSTASAS